MASHRRIHPKERQGKIDFTVGDQNQNDELGQIHRIVTELVLYHYLQIVIGNKNKKNHQCETRNWIYTHRKSRSGSKNDKKRCTTGSTDRDQLSIKQKKRKKTFFLIIVNRLTCTSIQRLAARKRKKSQIPGVKPSKRYLDILTGPILSPVDGDPVGGISSASGCLRLIQEVRILFH